MSDEATAGVKKRVWTPDQIAGIETTGCAVLVSAAAGSGKTAVLSERCAHLVSDAQPRCDIDQILVVTFAREAASEMKHRVLAALQARYAQAPSEMLQRQLALVEHAQISTLHSFCTKLIRQHFQRLGLDPEFGVLDEDDALLIRLDAAKALFEQHYADDADGDFARWIDAYGGGRDAVLLDQVIAAHGTLSSVVDPQGWVQAAQQWVQQGSEHLWTSPMGRDFAALVDMELTALARKIDENRQLIDAIGGFEKYVQRLDAYREVVEQWVKLFHDPAKGFDALSDAIKVYKPERAPSFSKDQPNKDEAKRLFDEVKDALTKGQLSKLCNFNTEQLSQGLARTLPHLNVFLGLVLELDQAYTAAKRRVNAIDFSDLERLALRLLCVDIHADELELSDVARQCHAQFRHVLVDEYQDINPVQDAILSLVSTDCLARRLGDDYQPSNLFCVGDVKQSIYRFRLAEPRRFLERRQLMRSGSQASERPYGKCIDLQANFRSRAPLLDAINQIFTRIMHDDAVEIEYDSSQELRAGREYPVDMAMPHFHGSPIELHLLPKAASSSGTLDDDVQDTADSDGWDLDSTQREAALIVQRIRQMMGGEGGPRMSVVDSSGSGFRPIEYSDIVILLRVVRHKAQQIADLLSRYGIPAYSQGGGGFFQAQEVQDVLALLHVLDNAQQDIPLAAVLRSPFVNLADVETALADIRIAHRDGAFHEAVADYAATQTNPLADTLRTFLEKLTRWRRIIAHRPLAEALWTIYEESGYLAFSAGMPDGAQRVANLHQLHDRAGQFGTFRRQGLYRFLYFLDELATREKDAEPAPVASSVNAVRIMSIHKTKGLEFPVVFIPDLSKRFNPQDFQGSFLVDRESYVGMKAVDLDRMVRYPTLSHLLVEKSVHRQVLAEEMRLMYVAMTRAKEHTILIATCDEKSHTNWENIWGAKAGRLPADVILSAKSAMDWIGPAAAMIHDERIIQTTVHEQPVAESSLQQLTGKRKLTPWQLDRAELKPLEPAPTDDTPANAVIARLSQTYPFAEFTRIPASRSVTGLAHEYEAAWPTASRMPNAEPSGQLALPEFIRGAAEFSPVDRGTATHLVFEHLDFTRSCEGEDLQQQIAQMVQLRQLTLDQAALVDHGAIEWFVHGKLGALIRDAEAVWREIPFDLALDSQRLGGPPMREPMDQVLIRGRVDLLVWGGRALHVIDYKTDRVTENQVSGRSVTYRQQLDLYREALNRVLPERQVILHLVYLTPRVVDSW